jgi:hypothetical protein
MADTVRSLIARLVGGDTPHAADAGFGGELVSMLNAWMTPRWRRLGGNHVTPNPIQLALRALKLTHRHVAVPEPFKGKE